MRSEPLLHGRTAYQNDLNTCWAAPGVQQLSFWLLHVAALFYWDKGKITGTANVMGNGKSMTRIPYCADPSYLNGKERQNPVGVLRYYQTSTNVIELPSSNCVQNWRISMVTNGWIVTVLRYHLRKQRLPLRYRLRIMLFSVVRYVWIDPSS